MLELKKMRPPGFEPGSSGWKPEILTTIPRTQLLVQLSIKIELQNRIIDIY